MPWLVRYITLICGEGQTRQFTGAMVLHNRLSINNGKAKREKAKRYAILKANVIRTQYCDIQEWK